MISAKQIRDVVNMARDGDVEGVRDFLSTPGIQYPFLAKAPREKNESFMSAIFNAAMTQIEVVAKGGQVSDPAIAKHLYLLFYTLNYCYINYGADHSSLLREVCATKSGHAITLMSELCSKPKEFSEVDNSFKCEFYGFANAEGALTANPMGHLRLTITPTNVGWENVDAELVQGSQVLGASSADQ